MTNKNNCVEDFCWKELIEQASLICKWQINATSLEVKKLIFDLIETAENPECYGPNLITNAEKLANNQWIDLEKLLAWEVQAIKEEVIAITNSKLDKAA